MGRWGQNLVECTQGKTDKIRFTVGVARTPEKAKAFAAAHGLRLVSAYEAVLADPDVDAVVLATPHTQHAEQVTAAARAGKHVFTDKPFALTRASAEAAVRACADAKHVLAVGFNWRYQPALREIRRMVHDGRLGRLLHIEGNFNGPSVYRFPREHWRQQAEEGPAGGMTGRGVHVVDAMLYLAGPVASVVAQSERLTLDYGLDDTTSMLFKFASGSTGYLGTVIATAEGWRMQVLGSKGWAKVGSIPHLHTWSLTTCMVNAQPTVIDYPQTSTERLELEGFADAIEGRAPYACPPEDALHGVAVLEAIVKSARTGQRERVP
ncbi:MAG: gfo/Idh/MocA family oxidoreductase [Candidatus Rokuibacteriota bacterium]|nr:MAG: gfo/Idh/MocA family oxidoreductase [Candidatus Rokubacteria bacterium]